MARKARRVVVGILLALVGIFVVAQLVPYGRRHTNPPVAQEPRWDSRATRALAVRACYDCHSNETRWPWYAKVAPASWLLQRDVDEGRGALNFSEWQRPQKEADEAARTVLGGDMPPSYYVVMHPSAHLSAAEKRALADGLTATIGAPGHDEAAAPHHTHVR